MARVNSLPTRSIVGFVGSKTRTRYVDCDLIRSSLLYVLETMHNVLVVHAGKPPFDLYVEEISQELGVDSIIKGPIGDWKVRFDPYERSPSWVKDCDLLIAFPVEGQDYSSCDPAIWDAAMYFEVPTMVVHRSGDWELAEGREWGAMHLVGL